MDVAHDLHHEVEAQEGLAAEETKVNPTASRSQAQREVNGLLRRRQRHVALVFSAGVAVLAGEIAVVCQAESCFHL